MSKERRLHPRTVVRMPARLRTPDASGWEDVILQDLSASGAAVLAGAEIPVEAEVRLQFRLPDDSDEPGKEFEILAMVVRSGRAAHLDAGKPILLGLHFLALHGQEFDTLRRWVWFHLESS